MIQILTSPVWWSTAVAFLGIILGLKLYIEKVKRADKEIEDKRQQDQALKNQNAE